MKYRKERFELSVYLCMYVCVCVKMFEVETFPAGINSRVVCHTNKENL